MTYEVKKLIDSVKVYQHPVPLCFDSIARALVDKSDFDRVVEELTKWNKVEDCLPKSKDILTQVLVKIQGKRLQCNLGIITATFDKRTGKFKTGEKYVEVTEWKPII